MSTHFNGLTPAEQERLALLAEECGEIVQVIGKILRHGFDSAHPSGGPTNRELLESEIGDVHVAGTLLIDAGDVLLSSIEAATDRKKAKLVKYLHHQVAKPQTPAPDDDCCPRCGGSFAATGGRPIKPPMECQACAEKDYGERVMKPPTPEEPR